MRIRTRQPDTNGQAITAFGDSSGRELLFVTATRAWRVDNISGAVLEVGPLLGVGPLPPRCSRLCMHAPSVCGLSDAGAQLRMMKSFPATSNLLRLTYASNPLQTEPPTPTGCKSLFSTRGSAKPERAAWIAELGRCSASVASTTFET